MTHTLSRCLCLSLPLACGMLMSAGCAAQQAPKPVTLYWTTAGAVDRLDVAHMGRSLRARGPTDEERAIAVWRYMRRTMFHYPMRNENHADQFDAAKLINVYGYSFCTQQGVAAAALAQAAGLKTRAISIPGHGMYEVFYDGRWHAFCTEFAFFVRTRDADRHIASMAEMKADTTLISKARQEGRGSSPFLPCAGGPEFIGEPEGTDQCPWSLTCRYYDEAFFVDAVNGWKPQGEPNPSAYSAWVPLRRGESLRLDWGAAGRFVPPSDLPRGPLAERFWPPRHLCGEKDRANPFFHEIAPYEQDFKGRKTYRYYGSGLQVWKPRLGDSGALAELSCARNLTAAGGAVRPSRIGMPAFAELEMTGPYPYVGGRVSGRTRVPAGASFRVSLQGGDAGGPWALIHEARQGDSEFSVALGDAVLPGGSTDPAKAKQPTRYRFSLRFDFEGNAELFDPVIQAAVQHNWSALPPLLPGENRLRVLANGPRSAIAGSTFELAWQEPGQPRTDRRKIAASETEWVIDVKGTTPPRMLHALLARQ